MHTEVFTSTDGFANLEPGWCALTQEPLRSFDWHFAWWQAFGEDLELRIYACYDDEALIGVAPFFVDRWLGQKRIRFLGSGNVCTDYAQIICHSDVQEEFVSQILADIEEHTFISIVELEGILNDAADLVLGVDAEDRNKYWRYDRELDPTWVLEIPDDWDAFVKRSKKSLRRKVKKARKRLDSKEVIIRSTLSDLNFETAFDTLVELNKERFDSKGECSSFADANYVQFLRDASRSLVNKQKAEILIGYSNHQPIASQLYLLGQQGPQLYQAGVCTNAMSLEPGHLMFTYAVGEAIKKGYQVFDFLRGSEPYKPYWGAVPHRLTTARFVSCAFVPTTINKAYQALRQLKHLAGKLSSAH